MNSTVQKNELIFGYSSGNLGEAKSLFVSMYLYLNTVASKKAHIFDNLLANDFLDLKDIKPKNLKPSDCINNSTNTNRSTSSSSSTTNPITRLVGNLNELNWKNVYRGFNEFKLPVDDKDDIKLIKMDPGTSVPLHSHNGKEFILVLDGSFCDEYGEYNKGDMQINDQNIKHNPTACHHKGCICLSITENDVVFFGKFASILNLFTFIKSFFK